MIHFTSEAEEAAALRKRLTAAEGALLALTARVTALEGKKAVTANKPANEPANSVANKANSRRGYQRDLMRKRRASAKAKEA